MRVQWGRVFFSNPMVFFSNPAVFEATRRMVFFSNPAVFEATPRVVFCCNPLVLKGNLMVCCGSPMVFFSNRIVLWQPHSENHHKFMIG